MISYHLSLKKKSLHQPRHLYVSGRTYKSVTMVSPPLQSRTALCDPMDRSLQGSSVHGILQPRITGVDCHFLLQGIFPTEGSNPCLLYLLHWQAGSLPLAPPGKSCGILVPWPDIEQRPLAVKAYSPNHWTTREFPNNG